VKHNWLVTVVTEHNERQTLRIRAGSDPGAQQKVWNDHPGIKVLEVRPDGS
jgi:hypothetical protein